MRRSLCSLRSTYLLYQPLQSRTNLHSSNYLNRVFTYPLNQKYHSTSNPFNQIKNFDDFFSPNPTRSLKKKHVTLVPGNEHTELIKNALDIIFDAGVQIEWDVQEVGEEGASNTIFDSIKKNGFAFIGPFTSPTNDIGEIISHRLNLFANVCNVRSLPERKKKMDIIIVKENKNLGHSEKMRAALNIGNVERLRWMRVCNHVFRLAENLNRKEVILAYDNNEWSKDREWSLHTYHEFGKFYPKIKSFERTILDAMERLTWNPKDLDVILSRDCGDLLINKAKHFLSPEVINANINEEIAVFEAKYRQGGYMEGYIAQTLIIQTVVMMLRYMGEKKAAARINIALDKAFKSYKWHSSIDEFATAIRGAMRE